MKTFCELCLALDSAKKPIDKVELIKRWWLADDRDAQKAWTVFFLLGGALKKQIPNRVLKESLANWGTIVPDLLEAVYVETGDLAAAVSSLLPKDLPEHSSITLPQVIEDHLLPLAGRDPEDQGALIRDLWRQLSRRDSYFANRILIGTFKVAVSRQIVWRALHQVTGAEVRQMTGRWRAGWLPETGVAALLGEAQPIVVAPRNRTPFHEIKLSIEPFSKISEPGHWLAECDWPGLRSRLQYDGSTRTVTIYSEEGLSLTSAFPELSDEAARWFEHHSIELEGQIVVWRAEFPAPRQELERRLGSGRVGKKTKSTWPVVFMVSDVLEWNGVPWLSKRLWERRALLETLVRDSQGSIRLSPVLASSSWGAMEQFRKDCRINGSLGVVLKPLTGGYQDAEPWLRFPSTSHRMKAVLVGAERGMGVRSGLYTDYILALRRGDELWPFTRVYSGLTHAEIKQIDFFVRGHTQKKLGRERWVEPQIVFEISFDEVVSSNDYRAGLTVKLPAVRRICPELGPEHAAALDDLEMIFKKALEEKGAPVPSQA